LFRLAVVAGLELVELDLLLLVEDEELVDVGVACVIPVADKSIDWAAGLIKESL
jgi:hypothetical protein